MGCSYILLQTTAIVGCLLRSWCCFLQTVTAADAVASARPLAAQPVRKGKVWLLLAGGAAALFGGTIALENNEQLFPAIARANKAMARSREQQQVCVQHLYLDCILTPVGVQADLCDWVVAARTTAKASDHGRTQ